MFEDGSYQVPCSFPLESPVQMCAKVNNKFLPISCCDGSDLFNCLRGCQACLAVVFSNN